MAVIASYTQNYFKFYEDNVDVFKTPSRFLKKKLNEYSFQGRRVINIPNFMDIHNIKIKHDNSRGYVLFFGRLFEHKGIDLVISAAQKLPDIPFKIAGGEVEEDHFEKKVSELGLNNVEFLGRLDHNGIYKVIYNSSF